MNHNILKLLIRSFDKDLSTDKKVLLDKNLRNDKELINLKKELNKTRELIQEQDYQFKPFFETRVMSKIENLKNEIDFISSMYGFYKKVVTIGFAVAVILMITFYFTGTPLSFGNIFGTKYMNTENLSAFLMFDN